MVKIVDHLKEPEWVLQRNLEKVKLALRKGEKVRIYHMGRIHGRLANLPGVEYLPLVKGVTEPDVVRSGKGIIITDHAYEKEEIIVRNQRNALAALSIGAPVTIIHPKGFIHGRLANLTGAHYKENPLLPTRKMPVVTGKDAELLARIIENHEYRMPYNGSQRGDLFIHWYYANRETDQLSACEIFHLNMLRYFNAMDRVECIHIRCAWDGKMTGSMKRAISILGSGKAKVDFRITSQKSNWEHDTIKECVEYGASSGKFVYYTHFKGASRQWGDKTSSRPTSMSYTPLDLAYWCYIMYLGLFSEDAANHPVIGPIACDNINKEYLNLDLTWSAGSRYQYIGSFQGFDGMTLKKAFARLGLNRADRDKYIWWGGRYAVEMFLALVFKESEVYSIAQKESTSAAYNMYSDNFCPQFKAQFQRLYLEEYAPVQLKRNDIAIVAVAKNEDLYIEEWIAHYLSLGASHIYIYDNNDMETDTMRQVSNMESVTVIPLYGDRLRKIGYQRGAYKDAYDRFGDKYGWMGFFDIDEFVEIDGGSPLPQFLENPLFDGASVIHLHWRYYGDNGQVRYMPGKLAERFPNPAPIDVKYGNSDKAENRYVKSIVRTGYFCMLFNDVHTSHFYGALCRVPSGNFEYANRSTDAVDIEGARIRHYGTKTIEEYIKRRIRTRRATGLRQIDPVERLDWFFRVNEKTPEKLKVIHEMLPNIRYPAQ